MKTIFLTSSLVFGVCASILPNTGFAEALVGNSQPADQYFFSSGGMVNSEYRIFDKGGRFFIDACNKNYKVGESCPVPDEYARKIFKIKPGMLVKVFKNSTPICSGKIEGFSYIAYESMDGFFLRSDCNVDGLMIIAESEKLLEKVIPGPKFAPVKNPKVMEIQRQRVLDYYSQKPSELQSLLSGYKRDNPQLKDTELLDVLTQKFNFDAKTSRLSRAKTSSELFLISGEEKEVRWGAKFLFIGAADGPLTFLGESRLIQQLNINGVPHLYINYQQQGSGVTVFKLSKVSGTTLETVFSEGGFSD